MKKEKCPKCKSIKIRSDVIGNITRRDDKGIEHCDPMFGSCCEKCGFRWGKK